MKNLLNLVVFALLIVAYSCENSNDKSKKTNENAIEEPFEYFENSWQVIGLQDYNKGTRISPDNHLLLSGGKWIKIKVGTDLDTLPRTSVKTLEEGWLPIVLLTTWDNEVRYNIKIWATPLKSTKNWKKAFSWPVEGENYLNWVQFTASNTGNKNFEARFNLEGFETPADNQSFSWNLAPGESEAVAVSFPYSPEGGKVTYDDMDSELWLQRTVDFWISALDTRTIIQTPDKKVNEAYLASHVCQLIARDHHVLKGGEGFYDKFFLRDAAYQVMELEEAGMLEEARFMVEKYLEHQLEDGRFSSPSSFQHMEDVEWDANGQSQWVLWQYYKITGDVESLGKFYPYMKRAAEWAIKTRKPEDEIEKKYKSLYGMLPGTHADGENLPRMKYHIVGYDFWNLRGMECTADAARILDHAADYEYFTKEADAYRQDINRVWERQKAPHFLPSWEGAGTHWGNTETLWPTMIFEKDDPRVKALCNHVRNEYHAGYIEGTIQWIRGERQGSKHPPAIHPYMGAYTTMVDLTLGNHERVVKDFYWYLLHSSASHAFPEGIFYQTKTAWVDLIPHVTGASNYAIMLRHMLVHEEKDELHLLKAIPDWWFEEGKEFRIENAPTHFGFINLVVKSEKDGVSIKVDLPERNPASKVILYLPESVNLINILDSIEVIKRSDQKERWDMEKVISLYKKNWYKDGEWIGPTPVKARSDFSTRIN